MMPKNVTNRRALKTLQSVAGLHRLIVACEEVQFPGKLVGHFSGGEVLRAILPKEVGKNPKEILGHNTEAGNVGAMVERVRCSCHVYSCNFFADLQSKYP